MTALSINMADPQVRRLMRQDRHASTLDEPPGAPGRPSLIQVAGDPARGFASQVSLASGKVETLVRYRDHVLTVDVYRLEGEPLQVHLICPRCCKPLRATEDRKRIEWDPTALHPHQAVAAELEAQGYGQLRLGLLSIEPFGCTWEMGGDAHNQGGLHTGGSLCRLKLGITRNVAKDA